MKKIIKRNQHGLKIIRRFNEDIWNILANKESVYLTPKSNTVQFYNKFSKKKLKHPQKSKNFNKLPKIFKNGKKILNYIYESYQNDFKYRKLLKYHKNKFFLVRRRSRFVYKVITSEKEFIKKFKSYKVKYYLNKLKLRRFYGNISQKKFKKIFKESQLNSNFLGKSFICLLESRLDVLLYRAHFFKSIFSARQYILHNGIYVNGLLLNKPNFKIKLFDFTFLKNSDLFYEVLKNKILNNKIFGNYPKYLEINYKLGSICLYKIPSVKEVPFPFFLNYKHIAYTFFK